jgi:thiamine pyrophosphate-dependent acetolactate synthase large subunit-like protein
MTAARGRPQHDGVLAGSGPVVFVSYSREDAEWMQRFVKMLEPERRRLGLEVWVDRAIATGREWRADVEVAIARADVALLLVSADFLASSFIVEHELPALVARKVPLACVLLRRCRYAAVDDLERVQWAHDPVRDGPIALANDVDGAIADVVALAEHVRAGVWASPMSWRSSFPEDHPQFLGFLPPEERGTAEALAAHDLVVVLGAPAFVYHVYRGPADAKMPPLYLVSDDDQVLARAREGAGIRSGVRAVVRALTASVREPSRPVPAGRTRRPRPPATEPITAEWLFAVMADELPEDVLLVEEIPSHLLVRREYLPVRARRTGLLSTGGGALGYGVAAAVGAALGAPDRTVVAVLGDGSTMYSVQALWTAAREHLPVTFVIIDNARYAAVDILSGDAKMPGVELGGIDFVALAKGMGCAAHRVEKPAEFAPALAGALADDRPTVLHVLVDPDPTKLY